MSEECIRWLGWGQLGEQAAIVDIVLDGNGKHWYDQHITIGHRESIGAVALLELLTQLSQACESLDF